jgi:hypothetical protein
MTIQSERVEMVPGFSYEQVNEALGIREEALESSPSGLVPKDALDVIYAAAAKVRNEEYSTPNTITQLMCLVRLVEASPGLNE